MQMSARAVARILRPADVVCSDFYQRMKLVHLFSLPPRERACKQNFYEHKQDRAQIKRYMDLVS